MGTEEEGRTGDAVRRRSPRGGDCAGEEKPSAEGNGHTQRDLWAVRPSSYRGCPPYPTHPMLTRAQALARVDGRG